jgi:hypothetical protein
MWSISLLSSALKLPPSIFPSKYETNFGRTLSSNFGHCFKLRQNAHVSWTEKFFDLKAKFKTFVCWSISSSLQLSKNDEASFKMAVFNGCDVDFVFLIKLVIH